MNFLQAIPALETHAGPFALLLARLTGLFIAAPLLSGVVAPMRFKALLVLVLGCAAYPALLERPTVWAASAHQLGGDVFSASGILLAELAIGFVIGVIAAIPLLSLESAGVIAGHQMGLSLAKVYNPETDIDADVLGQMLFSCGIGVFLTWGGLESLFGSVLASFDAVPAGGGAARLAPVELIAGMVTGGLELALRVSAPVTCVILLMCIIFGAVTKTMPQINIMSVGFAVKALGGVAILAFSVLACIETGGQAIHEALRDARHWVIEQAER